MGYGKVQSTAGVILSLLEQLCADGADLPPSLTPFYPRDPGHLNIGLEDTLLGASTLQLPPEHHILSESTSEQRSMEESRVAKSSTIKQQSGEGSTLNHQPTLEVLFNALNDVYQETTADTTIIFDGWDECNMDSEDEFRRLFGVLKTLPLEGLYHESQTTNGP